MSYYRNDGGRRDFLLGSSLSNAVRMLIAWNVIIYLIQVLTHRSANPYWIEKNLGLVPVDVWHGEVWQLVTYLFLHGGFLHILFNMLALWMFGSELEYLWGTRRFVRYYFFTGIGAGITTLVTTPHAIYPTIGASGAIFGLLLAYGVIFPNRPILLYFLFPIPAKYFVMIFGAIELFASLSGTQGGVAHFAHLGGLVFGWFYLKGFPGQRFFRRMRQSRKQRKFRVLEFYDDDDEDRDQHRLF
jgi:membrane associated rhomboid family serine protease